MFSPLGFSGSIFFPGKRPPLPPQAYILRRPNSDLVHKVSEKSGFICFSGGHWDMQVLLMRLYQILDTKGLSVLGEVPMISIKK